MRCGHSDIMHGARRRRHPPRGASACPSSPDVRSSASPLGNTPANTGPVHAPSSRAASSTGGAVPRSVCRHRNPDGAPRHDRARLTAAIASRAVPRTDGRPTKESPLLPFVNLPEAGGHFMVRSWPIHGNRSTSPSHGPEQRVQVPTRWVDSLPAFDEVQPALRTIGYSTLNLSVAQEPAPAEWRPEPDRTV